MKAYQLQKDIICIDLKSFYASVECVLLDVDPFKTPLVVADASRGGGSVVLAVSPYLKSLGIPSRCRLRDIPNHLNVIIRKPQMKTYMTFARNIIAIYLKYVSEEDIHIYSIDEVFIDLTEYLSFYKKDVYTLAKTIIDDVMYTTGIHATCGIGKNMLMAKLALDLDAKKAPEFIAEWNYDSIPDRLWKVQRLSDMWGIGGRMEKNLHRLGIKNIYDLAHANPNVLKHHFGVIGEELYYHANGIDMSLIQDKNVISRRKSYGQSQVLFKDYTAPDVYIVLRETVDEVARRLRLAKRAAHTITLGIGFSQDIGGGFGRQQTLEQPTMNASIIYQTCMDIFHTFYDGEPIRRIHVSVSQLKEVTFTQLSLFDDQTLLDQENQLYQTVDNIKYTYGKNAINRGSSELSASTIKARNKMIGGHHE
jgi:DNA polymerase V